MPTRPLPATGLLSRRQSLARAAALLAAVRAAAPAGFFAGCSLGIPKRARAVPVGLLHSQTGTMAVSETGVRDSELYAFERINAAGGLLGHPVEVSAPDTRSRTEIFVKRTRRLLDDGAAAVFGCWTSLRRKAVIPVFEEHQRLLFYPVSYEGNESSPWVVYGGSVPNQQILPAIDWLTEPAGGGKRKIFLLGSDYVFPRTANFIAKKHLASRDLRPAGEVYLPLGTRDFTTAVQQIVFSGADCVLSTVNGDSNIGLFAALAEAKIDPEKLPVVSTSISEDDLRGLLPEKVRGHYAVAGYFQSVGSEANRRWLDGFRDEFGYDRVTGDAMEAAWCLVHLWQAAVEKAGSFETAAVRQAFRDGLEFAGPRGTVRLDPRTQHCTRPCRIGRIGADPYPAIAFPGWKCDWLEGGLTRGPEVSIDGDV